MKAHTTIIMKDLAGYLTPEQVSRMEQSAKNTRDKLLIRVLFHTGRRITEVVGRKAYCYTYKDTGIRKDYATINGLRPKDINFHENQIIWAIIKKRQALTKIKPIDKATAHYLHNYIKEENIQPEERVFPITRRRAYTIINQAAQKAGISLIGEGKKVHPHHLRHSFAVNFIKKSRKPDAIKKLQRFLEHSTLEMTSSYLQFSTQDDAESIEEVYQK